MKIIKIIDNDKDEKLDENVSFSYTKNGTLILPKEWDNPEDDIYDEIYGDLIK